jgi:thymidylate synthase (FAD)
MRVVQPEVLVLTPIYPEMLSKIERAGRTCYKSEREFTIDTAKKFVAMLIERGHESVLEHDYITVKFIVDRGVSHEIVRHRIGSYSQESTRYCNYAKDKFDNEITVIEPFGLTGDAHGRWETSMQEAEQDYMFLISKEVKPEWARSVLPNSLKTEIVCTYNFREWRHFFNLRTAQAAHPQMRQVAQPLLQYFRDHVPVIFDDVGQLENPLHWAEVHQL